MFGIVRIYAIMCSANQQMDALILPLRMKTNKDSICATDDLSWSHIAMKMQNRKNIKIENYCLSEPYILPWIKNRPSEADVVTPMSLWSPSAVLSASFSIVEDAAEVAKEPAVHLELVFR